MYHKLTIEQTLAELDVGLESGLSQSEAEERSGRYGANSLTSRKKDTILKSVLRQLNEPMIYILFAAAIISAVFGEWVDAAVILAIVVINAVIGVCQERRAEKALEALKRLTVSMCVVRREGASREIPATELVVGDVVLVEAGRIVPADLRLVATHGLTVNESALTGESVPVEKKADFIASGDIPLGDRINCAYQGTVVTGGRGEGVVVATGMSTEVGHIAAMLNEQEEGKTPLQKKLAGLGKILGIAALCACALIFVMGIIEGRDLIGVLLMSISLAVAVVPEGLTAVVTIVLALGVTRMVSKNAIVRNLPSVETLGSVNVICTDKTGTLTQNKMTVVALYYDGRLFEFSGSAKAKAFDAEAAMPLLHGLTLCNDASVSPERTGDPTELALIDFTEKQGVSKKSLEGQFSRIGEKSFDSERKMMTTLHDANFTTLSYTKGATDCVLPNCAYIWQNGGIQKLTDEDRRSVLESAEKLSGDALRVLALAMRSGDSEPTEKNMVFIGLVGMIDPPREEVASAIALCRQAGIRVVMITGDHKITASAIGIKTGIVSDATQVMTGAEIDALSDEAFFMKVEDIRIFARVDPRHKMRIVKALKAHGNIVSMTGDGVNDAPSLKAADIGVAMGITGTDAAKDASDIVLTDDNFSTIASAVEEGRGIFDNIRKAIYFLLSSNAGELLCVFIAIVLNWGSPLLPLHILWVNLITDSLPALALGVDPSGRDIMRRPPRSANEGIFAHGGGFTIGGYGAVIAAVTLIAFRLGGESAGTTFAFLTLALSQLFHSIGIRAGERSVFAVKYLNNKLMILAFFLGVALQLAVVFIPVVNDVFGINGALELSDWAIIAALSVAPLVVHEAAVAIRYIIGRRNGKRNRA